MIGYSKVRFSGPAGKTAGIILPADEARHATLETLSWYFPYTEARKMTQIEISPEYPTYEQAFAHRFSSKNPKNPKRKKRRRPLEMSERVVVNENVPDNRAHLIGARGEVVGTWDRGYYVQFDEPKGIRMEEQAYLRHELTSEEKWP